MRTLPAHQPGCPCPSRVATDAHMCGGEAERPRSAGSSRCPPPLARGASSACPATHLDFLCHVAQCSRRLRVGPLFSDGGVSGPGSLWPQGTRPSFWAVWGPLPPPLGTRRASRRASSLTAPPGQAPPTPPGPCNQSRSAGSPAQAGSHRYQLTAWVPFPFTQGRLTMADSPHGGPGPPPRERSRPAIGPHDLTPRRGGPPLLTGRTNGAFSGCQRPGSGRNQPPVPARLRGCLFPSV